MKCFHHTDLDGYASGAVVKYFNPECELISFNYNDKFPFNEIEKNEEIIMIDVSLSINEMIRINNKYNFIFIDHHKSIIDEITKFGVTIKGIRNYTDNYAACKLTWKYFTDKEIPWFIELSSKYDVWDHNEEVLHFYYGINTFETDPSEKNNIWIKLFQNYNEQVYYCMIFKNEILNIGKSIELYINNKNKKLQKNAFEINFHGKKFIAINHITHSKIFDGLYDNKKYDGMMIFYYMNNIWKFSLFNNKEDKSLLEIAIANGGGGHPHACGFTCKEIPFDLI